MARLTRFSLRHPALALVLIGAVTLAAVAGLPQLRTDVGYRAFLGPEHPAVLELDALIDRFGGGLPMAAVWDCSETARCESVFDPGSLEMAAAIESALAGSPWLRVVRSPASAPVSVPTALGPWERHFVNSGRVLAAAERDELAARALVDPSWRRVLVSEDGRIAAVVAELTSSESDAAVGAYADLDQALAPFEAEGIHFARVGGPVEFVVAGGELERATAQLIPVMVALVGATLWLLFRRFAAAAAVLGATGLAVLWTMGLLGWLSAFGFAQNSLTQTLPPLILVIGVCDGIHLVTRAAGLVESGHREGLLEAAASDVGRPCWMTSVTTAAGFLSFATTDLQSFAHFGVIAAFGVMAALFTSFSVLPLLLRVVEPERLRHAAVHAAWERVLDRLVAVSARRPGIVLATAVLVAAGSSVGFSRLRVDASFEELYGEESRVVAWARAVGDRLRRPDTLEVEVALPTGAAIEDPATLLAIATSAERLAAIETLGPARSLVDALAWTHRSLRGGDAEFQRVGDSAAENAALLAALEHLSGDEQALRRWLGPQRVRTRISIESEKTPQDVLRKVMHQVREALHTSLPPGFTAVVTGPLAVVHSMIDDIRSAQLESFASAALAVLVLVAIFLRSATWGAVALVPTALPVLATLGTMGLLGIALDVGSAMVAAVVLGIAVDDVIHLLEHYRRGRRQGASADNAMAAAVSQVGRALVTTSFALTVGFAALSLSPWNSVASFGTVSAVAILGALLSVLLVLPALVLTWERHRPSPRPQP